MAEGTETVSANLDPTIAAKYNATKATLAFSLLRAQQVEKEAVGIANANYAYQRGVALNAEPVKLRVNQNAANSQGLAESGQLARVQGQTQLGFAEKGARNAELRRQAVNKLRTGLTATETGIGLKGIENVANANAEQQRYLVENPPQKAPAAPAVPSTIPQTGWIQGPGGRTAYRTGPPRARAISKAKGITVG